ncbi:EamA family transporter [Thermoflexus sp.]|uniref:EamA family transporter n=1 Tax=Thermoflexus sp. TaxID=1969742 RepID=UPI002991B66B|nr:EamA family transporter [Thermoflexus sp.]MDW8065213.1 EamA family transporter [Anaerolineae bacterium]
MTSTRSHAPIEPERARSLNTFLKPGVWYGLGAAICWAIDPILVRHGLMRFSSPLWGAALSLLACVGIYGLLLGLRRVSDPPPALRILAWQTLAGLLVALSTWIKWLALQLAPAAVVLALGRLSVPLVVMLSPLILGRSLERITIRLIAGATLITLGTILLAYSS